MKLKLSKIKPNKAKFLKSCTTCSFFLLVLALVLQVSITNKYAIKGGEMVELLEKQQNLEKDISLLRLEVSEVSSLAYIEEKATSLGFVEYAEPVLVIASSKFAAVSDY